MEPKDIGAIVTAYTGILCGKIEDFRALAERLMERKIAEAEYTQQHVTEEIKKRAKPHFIRLAKWCAGEATAAVSEPVKVEKPKVSGDSLYP